MTNKPDLLRLILTFAMAAIGILVVLIAYIVAINVYAPGAKGVDKPAESVVAILGPVTAVIGTLTGYVAGQSAGAAGKEKAEERADTANKQMRAVLDEAQPGTLEQARQKHPDWFGTP